MFATPHIYSVGETLPEIVMRPTALLLFRYSAVTWNSHRIHFDRDWAAREGHAGLVVHSHLHAANALRVLTDGLGTQWRVVRAAYRILRPGFAGDRLTASAQVTEVSPEGNTLTFALREKNQHGDLCLEGTATATLRA